MRQEPGEYFDVRIGEASRISQCRKSDLFVTAEKILWKVVFVPIPKLLVSAATVAPARSFRIKPERRSQVCGPARGVVRRSYENHFISEVWNDKDAPCRGSAGALRNTGCIPFARRSNEEPCEGACCGASRLAMDDPRDAERWGCAPDLRPSCTFEFPSRPDAALAAPDAPSSSVALCCASTCSILRSLDASLQQQDSVKGRAASRPPCGHRVWASADAHLDFMWCPMVDVAPKCRCTTVSSSSDGLSLSLLPLMQSSANRLISLATRLPPSPASSSSFRHSLRVVRVPMVVWDVPRD